MVDGDGHGGVVEVRDLGPHLVDDVLALHLPAGELDAAVGFEEVLGGLLDALLLVGEFGSHDSSLWLVWLLSSFGIPSTRSPMMLRWMSPVPAAIHDP